MLSKQFYDALAKRESGGNAQIINQYGFMGLYQMGKPALQDVGYINGNGTWTGKDGINSQADFLNNPSIQDKAVREYHQLVWNRYLPAEIKESVGKTMNGIQVTKSGLVAAAHLVGHGGLKKFINSNGQIDPADQNTTHCSEYLRQFGGY